MSSINDYLDYISTANYGSDVRDAIVSSIRECYKDATGHPDSVAALVQEYIDREENIDNTVSLLTGLYNSIGEIVYSYDYNNDIIEIPISTGQFECVDQITLSPGNWIIKPSTFVAGITNNNPDKVTIYLSLSNTIGGGSSYPTPIGNNYTNDEYAGTILGASGSHVHFVRFLNLTEETTIYMWVKHSGRTSSNIVVDPYMTAIKIGEAIPSDGTSIVDQVVENTEDISILDGKVTTNIASISDLESDVDTLEEDVADLKQDLIDNRLVNYTFKDNYYINTNTYEEASNSSYSYATINVAPYKNLHIRTHAYKTAGICFYDSNGNGIGHIYSTGTADTYLFDELVTLPEGTAVAKITCLKAQKSDFSVKTTSLEFYTGLAQSIDSKTPNVEFVRVKNEFNDLCANSDSTLTPVRWELGALNSSTGATVASTKVLRTIDYIEVGYKKSIILNPSTGYKVAILVFDSTYAVITPDEYKNSFGVRTEFILPHNASYLKFQIARDVSATMTVDEASNVSISYKTTLQQDIGLAVGDDEIPDYYKANDYIYNKIDRINELYNLYSADGTAFVFVTDQHFEHPRFNAQNSPSLINYIYRNTNIETLVDGGDNADGGSAYWCKLLKQSWGGRIYHVMGNHDYMYGTDTREQELYAMCDAVNQNQIGVNNRHYYYVDNSQEKIRLIVLNSYAPAGSASSAVAGQGYESEQLLWLSNTALNVADGWGIIIFVHGLYAWNDGESGMGEGYYISHGEGGLELVSILENYDGNGEIISIISGHSHLDRVVYSSNANICCINTTCDANTVSRKTTADPRTSGTIGEQAIDVFILDRPNRTWHIVRIGTPAYNGIGSNPGIPSEERTVTY